MVLLRAGLSSFVSLTWCISWRTMSLADTYAIGFTSPLIMTHCKPASLGVQAEVSALSARLR
jgi:hypothetical protein